MMGIIYPEMLDVNSKKEGASNAPLSRINGNAYIL